VGQGYGKEWTVFAGDVVDHLTATQPEASGVIDDPCCHDPSLPTWHLSTT
jgi:hypothetical protein